MEHSIAAKYAARSAARFVHPSSRARERQLGLRAAGSFQAATTRATVLRRPDGNVLARLRGGWRAFRAARPRPGHGRPTAARDRDALGAFRPSRDGPPVQRRHGAVARLRTTTATSAGGIVIRFEAGDPHLVVGSRRRERDIVTWTLPKGTPNPGETREQTAIREVAEETGPRGPDHRPARLDRVLVRPARDADPQDRPLLPDGADRRRPRPPRPRVRAGPLDRASRSARRLLTFETERALVARARHADRRRRSADPAGRPGTAGQGAPARQGA